MFRALAILFFVSAATASLCQTDVPLLERSMTISFTNEKLDAALKKIGEQGKFTFSYNASILDGSKPVNFNFRNKTVREILDAIFKGTIEYKIRANHIILTKAKAASKQTDEKVLSGYVVDEATGERLKNVSVYDPVTLTSAVTDSYGYFEIKIDKAASAVNLSVNKQNYADTVVAVDSWEGRLMNIPIRIDKQKWINAADSVGQKLRRFWNNKILNRYKPNVVNIRDTLYRDFQFSVVPFVGTNHKLSGNVVNDFSLNLVGGVARGVQKFEAGGAFNIDREDVTGWQLAGGFNAVGGKVHGAQFAGVFNAAFDSVKGAQFAGVANIDWNSSTGFGGAGVINFTRRTSRGLHLAGATNFTLGKQIGFHGAGAFNFATSDAGPFQGAGAFNFTAGNMRGVQWAGALNFTAKNVKGAQVAGVMNFAGKKVTGSQIAGVLNYATKVKGVQVGLVNIADSVKGVPIGFFSFVLRGYHKIEFSADEIFYANAAFRTGVRQFYNIFQVGAKPHSFPDNQTYWTFGYGFGTAPRLTKWLSLNFDITSNQIVTDQNFEAINLLNKVYLGVDLAATKFFSLTLGATMNGYITDITYDSYQPLFTHYMPNLVHNETFSNNINMKMWWGAKVGLRFL